MVGAVGFEPTTFWSQTRRATKLRYAPTTGTNISQSPLCAIKFARRAESTFYPTARRAIRLDACPPHVMFVPVCQPKPLLCLKKLTCAALISWRRFRPRSSRTIEATWSSAFAPMATSFRLGS
ncbi:hypothetical protein SBV1_2770004 [Verrucomicrobia bacterium]|nr:hypothetical protein SBV1_2770004 [Verrucomicrobiota bacterium]